MKRTLSLAVLSILLLSNLNLFASAYPGGFGGYGRFGGFGGQNMGWHQGFNGFRNANFGFRDRDDWGRGFRNVGRFGDHDDWGRFGRGRFGDNDDWGRFGRGRFGGPMGFGGGNFNHRGFW